MVRKEPSHLASVQRMIPVTKVLLPDDVVDLPIDPLRRFDGQRSNRPNDITKKQMLSKQQELQAEANSEAAAAAAAQASAAQSHINAEQGGAKVKAAKKLKETKQNTSCW